jgi:hypothetical protein
MFEKRKTRKIPGETEDSFHAFGPAMKKSGGTTAPSRNPLEGANQEIQHLLRTGGARPGWHVSRPGDAIEQEADRAAERAFQPANPASVRSAKSAAAGPGGESNSAGQRLDPETRDWAESNFGPEAGDAVIHRGPAPDGFARALRAKAVTVGKDVFFAAGEDPQSSADGGKLLAHELAHVARRPQGVLARAVSPEYPKIKNDLSYGLLDWEITDEECDEAVRILWSLPEEDLEDTLAQMEADGLLARLLEKTPKTFWEVYDPLFKTIVQKRTAASTAEHIESLMSYGLLDWAITAKEAHTALEMLKGLESTPEKLRDVVVAIPAKQYERFYGRLSGEDRAANLPFLQLLETIRSTGMTVDEMAAAQKSNLEAKAAAQGVGVGEQIRGEVNVRGYGGYTATNWPSMPLLIKAVWYARFGLAYLSVFASAPREILEILKATKDAGGDILFKPQELEEAGPNTLGGNVGDDLWVGTRWVEAAGKNPENVYANIAHELGGHREFGETLSWTVMEKTMALLPPQERTIAESGPRDLNTAYDYMETEIYAELRELPYWHEGVVGDEPTKDVERQMKNIKEAFAPVVAEGLIRGLRRRIQADPAVSQKARDVFDQKANAVFHITFD